MPETKAFSATGTSTDSLTYLASPVGEVGFSHVRVPLALDEPDSQLLAGNRFFLVVQSQEVAVYSQPALHQTLGLEADREGRQRVDVL